MSQDFNELSAALECFVTVTRPRASEVFVLIEALADTTPASARPMVAEQVLAVLRKPLEVDCRPDQAEACVRLLDWGLPGFAENLAQTCAEAYAGSRHPGLAQGLVSLLGRSPSLEPGILARLDDLGVTPLRLDGCIHLPCAVGGPMKVAQERLFVDAATTTRDMVVSEPRRLRLGLERRCAWLRHRFGATYGVLVAPDKQRVHGQELDAADLAYLARVDALLDNVRASGVATCHPCAELRDGALICDPFYRTDSHWNDYGAFLAYGALRRTLEPQIHLPEVTQDRFSWEERSLFTDLGMSMVPEIRETTRFARFDDDAVRLVDKSTLPSSRYGWQVYENRDKSLPVAVVFRDSFFTAMIPFMARSVSKLVCVGVDSGEMLVDLVEDLRPDLVLNVSVERFAVAMRAADLFRDEVPWKDSSVGPAMGGLDIPHYGSAVDLGH